MSATIIEMIKGPNCNICGEMYAWRCFNVEQYRWFYKCKCGHTQFCDEVE